MSSLNKLNDTDKAVYDSYMKDMADHDPESYKMLAGVDPTVAYGILKQEPDFNDVSKVILSAPSSPTKPPLQGIQSATEPIRKVLSSAGDMYNKAYDVLNKYTPSSMNGKDALEVAGQLNKLTDSGSRMAENAADKISTSGLDPTNGALPDTIRGISYALGLMKVPDTAAQVAGSMALGGIMSNTSEIADSIQKSLPARGRAVVNPSTGLIQKVAVPDAEALANSDFISNPETHNELAKSQIESLQAGAKSLSDNNYNRLGDFVGENGVFREHPIDVSDASRIANNAPADLLQHPDFQSVAMRKLRSILADDPNQGPTAGGDIVAPHGGPFDTSYLKTPAELADFHEMEPSGTELSAQETVQLMKSLNKTIASNYKNPTGNFAQQLKDSLDTSFQADAPDILKEAHKTATEGYKNYMDTFFDKNVQKFLNNDASKAHNTALSGTDSLKAIRNAGGDTALEHLRRSAGYDLYNDIVDKNMSGNDVLAQFRTNRALDALFTDEQATRFANIANSRLEAIRASIDQSTPKVTTMDKMMSAGKRAAATATGGLIGGVPGAAIAAGAADIIGQHCRTGLHVGTTEVRGICTGHSA